MRLWRPIHLTLDRTFLALSLNASFCMLVMGMLAICTSVIGPIDCYGGGGRVTQGQQQPSGGAHDDAQLGERTEYVDLIELNHFIDGEGREVFRQLIFYDWSDLDKRFHVRAWRLIKNDRQLPRRFWKPMHYECHWHDDGQRKKVSAKQLRETWAQQDPERVNRKFLPEDQRIPLFAND